MNKKRLLDFLNRKIFGPLVKVLYCIFLLNKKYKILNTNPAAIGHLCVDVDCFLREREVEKYSFIGVLIAPSKTAANRALLSIWKATPGLVVIENSIACYFLEYLKIYSSTSFDCSKYCANDGVPAEAYKYYNCLHKIKDNIIWPPKLLNQAEILFSQTFPDVQIEKVAVLHSRDSLYDEISNNANYKSQNYRNSSLESYHAILRYLFERNYITIRIGEYQNEMDTNKLMYLRILNKTKIEKDLLELYISSKCAIFLGSASGASNMALIWGRPVFLINVLPYALLRPHGSNGMAIPKLLKNGNKILNAKEIFKNGYHWLRSDVQYNARNIKIQNNNSEDCLEDFCDFFEAFVCNNDQIKSKLINSSESIKYKKTCLNNSYDFYAKSLIPRKFFKKFNIV